MNKILVTGATGFIGNYVVHELCSRKNVHLNAIKNGDNVFNMSGREQIRDFVHAEKAAELIIDNVLNNNSRGIYNICSGTPISVRKLIEDRIKELNSDISLDLGHYPYPDYEPISFWGKNRCFP